MSLFHPLAATCLFLALTAHAQAQSMSDGTGGDTFVAGGSLIRSLDAPGDAFAAGRSALARGATRGDLHVAGFGGDPAQGNMARLLAFAGVIVAIALLNFIPFVGWVAIYTLVLLGIGAMTNALFQRLIGTPEPVLDIDMKPIDS